MLALASVLAVVLVSLIIVRVATVALSLAEILPGDTLVLYGQDHRLVELDHRLRGRAGDTAHAQAAAEQRQLV
jgi:hypothetical protein